MLIIIFLLSCPVACGKKSPPLAPEATFPEAVSDLKAFSRQGVLYLKWTIPQRNTNGSKLNNLLGFHVFRQMRSLEQNSCSTCPTNFELIGEIDLDFPRAARVQEGVVLWPDRTVKPGYEYIYFVRAYNIFKAASLESNRVHVFWIDPLPPPVEINLRHEHKALEISWKIPTQLWSPKEKGEFWGMNIYRRTAGESFSLLPLNAQPIKEEKYLDMQVELGQKYFYEVRAIRNFRGTLIEGLGSQQVSGSPKKILPPAPPTGLVGVYQKEGIALRWDAHPEPDLAGFDLYRRGEDEKEFQKINPTLLTGRYFLDVHVDHRKTYYYRLKAIDSSPDKKESEFSREAEVIPLSTPSPPAP